MCSTTKEIIDESVIMFNKLKDLSFSRFRYKDLKDSLYKLPEEITLDIFEEFPKSDLLENESDIFRKIYRFDRKLIKFIFSYCDFLDFAKIDMNRASTNKYLFKKLIKKVDLVNFDIKNINESVGKKSVKYLFKKGVDFSNCSPALLNDISDKLFYEIFNKVDWNKKIEENHELFVDSLHICNARMVNMFKDSLKSDIITKDFFSNILKNNNMEGIQEFFNIEIICQNKNLFLECLEIKESTNEDPKKFYNPFNVKIIDNVKFFLECGCGDERCEGHGHESNQIYGESKFDTQISLYAINLDVEDLYKIYKFVKN